MSEFSLPDEIKITQQEAQLFDFLRHVVETNKTSTVMRIAGGWVRDKLMGIEADDIDISLDNMTGQEFATLVKETIAAGNPNALSSNPKPKAKVAVIGIRPELGKFVETATVNCRGFSLDLLSLRSQVQVGDKLRNSDTLELDLIAQAAEDAHLRDFTVNAMFYNINTGYIEDFVQGKNHLQEKLIRCPNAFDAKYFQENGKSDLARELEGTWLRLREDPHRSLRSIRFACKYGFQLSNCIKEVISSDEIHKSLSEKTTKERIYTETQKIFLLSVEKSLKGLRHLKEFGLLPSVFPMACDFSLEQWKEREEICLRCATQILENTTELHVQQNLLLLASFFTPLCGTYTYPNSAQHDFPFTKEHMKETWKYPTKCSSDTLDIMIAAGKLVNYSKEEWDDTFQVKLGRLLRDTKAKWVHAFDIAKTWEILLRPQEEQVISESYSAFMQQIESVGFTGNFGKTPWEMKPIFSGKQLSTDFNVKPGKIMGILIDNLVDWQLLHMNGTTEEAAQFIKEIINKQQ